MLDRKLLRPEELCEVLGLGRSTVYQLLRTQQLPCVRVGRAVRVPVRALDQWIAQQASAQTVTDDFEDAQP